jgi:hypothetical protein
MQVRGLPIAEDVPQALRRTRASIIYGESLPQRKDYEDRGDRNFKPRRILTTLLTGIAKSAGRPPLLVFINTIQHDASNYHDP